MKTDVAIVGCGFAGAVMARRLAEEKGAHVLVVDKHDHIAGHAYDEYNTDGVLIHRYGPHIFHTNDKNVWDWLSRFTVWNEYQHRVLSYVDGRLIPMPISCETINGLLGENFSVTEAQAWFREQAVKTDKIVTSKDVVVSQAGELLYEKLFKNYTKKQWDRYPDELSPDIISRIPFRDSRDTRYFTDKYQGIPKSGYTALFRNILNHERIRVMLNTNWFDIRDSIAFDKLVYTGPIDQYFDCKFGKLEYRSLKFEYETFFDREFFQDAGTVNYPNDYDYTRISEYKRFTGQKIMHTTIAREYPSNDGEPFYPVPGTDQRDKLERYKTEAASERTTIFIGRLAQYEYLNMDRVVHNALALQI